VTKSYREDWMMQHDIYYRDHVSGLAKAMGLRSR
jgi:hypothetical protein